MEERKPEIKKQIFKTDAFFVDKKHEKKMNLLRKSNLIFNEIANAIEHSTFRENRATKQRLDRIAKRTHYYKFWLFESDYDFKKIGADEISESLKLKKGDFIINEDYEGTFKGTENSLIELLESFYGEKTEN